MKPKPVVVIAMSGGVDSSVAAALLVDQGYSVIGMMLNLWSEKGSEQVNRCCTPDSMVQARRVASILSIPFYVLDAKKIFFNSVVSALINGYTQNQTPNPCLICNRIIRWDFLLNHALAAGADFLATGHYARVNRNQDGIFELYRSVDLHKDQSYVLHVLAQPQLAHAIFPLGDYTKAEVRQLALKYKLPVADRPDSQDLCFIGGDGDYRHFLARYAPQTQNPGLIMDQNEHILGNHQGLANYTIGQRKGIQVSSSIPLYVIEKDSQRNILVVGTREETGKDYLIANQANWIAGSPPAKSFDASVKIRYNAHDLQGNITVIDETSFRVVFNKRIPDISPGQAAVLYNGDICLGGGIIFDSHKDLIQRDDK